MGTLRQDQTVAFLQTTPADLEEIRRLTTLSGNADVSEWWCSHDYWVADGGVLPPNRPEGRTCLHVKDGRVEWWALELID
jgi:hypothetical protein